MERLLHATNKCKSSENTKLHAVYTHLVKGYSKEECAEIYNKSRTTIANWVKRFVTEGDLSPAQKVQPFRRFSEEHREWLVTFYNQQATMYLDEAKLAFEEHFGLSISRSTVCRILHDAGMSWKVIERRARQVSLPQVLDFCDEMASIVWALHNLVFLDEVSIDNRGALRTHGYGEKGKRLIVTGEFTRKARVSLLCFLGQTGMLEAFETEGTFNRTRFFECCRSFALSGRVQPFPGKNSVWVMDGARIHLDPYIVEYLRELGIVVVFLPPYAPFFNPIEYIFGFLKRHLQRTHIEDIKTIIFEVCAALKHFKNYDCTKLFEHCGYSANGVFDASKGLGQTRL